MPAKFARGASRVNPVFRREDLWFTLGALTQH